MYEYAFDLPEFEYPDMKAMRNLNYRGYVDQYCNYTETRSNLLRACRQAMSETAPIYQHATQKWLDRSIAKREHW